MKGGLMFRHKNFGKVHPAGLQALMGGFQGLEGSRV